MVQAWMDVKQTTYIEMLCFCLSYNNIKCCIVYIILLSVRLSVEAQRYCDHHSVSVFLCVRLSARELTNAAMDVDQA